MTFFRLECTLNINSDLGQPQPLYFYENSTEFVTTSAGSSKFTLEKMQQIDLYCSSGFRQKSHNITNESLTATCMGEKGFTIANKTMTLRNISCVNYPEHKTKVTNETCLAGKLIEIGFDVHNEWVSLMKICHDVKEASTKWTQHELKPQNMFHQRAVERILFIQGDFYKGMKVDTQYTKYVQRKTIGKILGSKELAEKLVQDNSELYLARGHLAAKADFIFASHQLATFYFINVAPQW